MDLNVNLNAFISCSLTTDLIQLLLPVVMCNDD